MVRIVRILGECHIVPSALLISNLITFPPRIHRRVQGSILATARCQVLRQGG